MSKQAIVAIGASAGGVDALIRIARDIPAGFPAPILVVLHIPAESPSHLPRILDRVGDLRAKSAEDGETLENGVLYIATPDNHLLADRGGIVRTSREPHENRHRPAIDPLFRSVAVAAGRYAIGVVLTGTLADGTAGLQSIKRRGGIAVVQSPADAMYASMPQSAVDHVDVDYVVPLAEIGPLLDRLVRGYYASIRVVAS